MPDGVVPVPPDRIRPGQLGAVLLGRVIIGDIAATMVDLSVRGLLAVEERDGGQASWLLCALASGRSAGTLLAYESTLLTAVSEAGGSATMQSLAPGMPNVLSRARDEILRDAVSNGWLHRLHRDQRTDAGEQLVLRIHRFQSELRKFVADQGMDALADRLLPFALHFGIVERDRLPLVQFAHGWVAAFGRTPGWYQPQPSRPSFDEPDAVAKPTIDEQMMDTNVGLGIWLTGWGT